MLISDWISDVCSSDLAGLRGEIKEEAFAVGGCRGTFAPKACRPRRARQVAATRAIRKKAETLSPDSGEVLFFASFPPSPPRASNRPCPETGTAACRATACQYA